jgi:hypothetical protein
MGGVLRHELFFLARIALSLVVTLWLQIYENMVALTGIERANVQFSSV